MNKSLLSVLVTCLLVILSSCSTSYQATNCPTFKQKDNTSAIANAKQKQKLNKEMQKHKAYLSEKYAINRLENDRAIQAENASRMAQVVKSENAIQPIQAINATAVASSNSNFIIPERVFVKEKLKLTNKETEISVVDLLPTEIVSKFTPKQKERIEKKIEKVKKKAAKKAQKKNNTVAPAPDSSGSSQVIALILVLVAGLIGAHRFYLGYIGIGIAQILTLGGCGIWTLIDLVRIITGDLQPKDGRYTETL